MNRQEYILAHKDQYPKNLADLWWRDINQADLGTWPPLQKLVMVRFQEGDDDAVVPAILYMEDRLPVLSHPDGLQVYNSLYAVQWMPIPMKPGDQLAPGATP